MANPKTFRILGKMLILAGVIAFLASFLVTFVGMLNNFQQISQTGDLPEAAVKQTVSLAFRASEICTPIGLVCLGAGVYCYREAARLKRRAGILNSEFPAA
jgi:hypothetical protein